MTSGLVKGVNVVMQKHPNTGMIFLLWLFIQVSKWTGQLKDSCLPKSIWHITEQTSIGTSILCTESFRLFSIYDSRRLELTHASPGGIFLSNMEELVEAILHFKQIQSPVDTIALVCVSPLDSRSISSTQMKMQSCHSDKCTVHTQLAEGTSSVS